MRRPLEKKKLESPRIFCCVRVLMVSVGEEQTNQEFLSFGSSFHVTRQSLRCSNIAPGTRSTESRTPAMANHFRRFFSWQTSGDRRRTVIIILSWVHRETEEPRDGFTALQTPCYCCEVTFGLITGRCATVRIQPAANTATGAVTKVRRRRLLSEASRGGIWRSFDFRLLTSRCS